MKVQSLTYYFLVRKGGDICMVYNGVSGGLNDSLWGPNFSLLAV